MKLDLGAPNETIDATNLDLHLARQEMIGELAEAELDEGFILVLQL